MFHAMFLNFDGARCEKIKPSFDIFTPINLYILPPLSGWDRNPKTSKSTTTVNHREYHRIFYWPPLCCLQHVSAHFISGILSTAVSP